MGSETMVISTRVYVEHPDLALSQTIRSCPETTLGVVSDAGTDPHHDAYFFWVETSDFERVEAELEADHTVASFTPIVEGEDRRTYRIEYTDDALLLSPTITDIGGLVLDTESRANGWLLHLELPDHESLYRLHEYASEADIRLDVLDIQQTQETNGRPDFGLTEPQVEALIAAYVHGFYDEPREISLEGLASILDISQSAVSGRLRRGSARLVEEILVEDDE